MLSIKTVSSLLLCCYILSDFFIRKRKDLDLFLIFLIFFLPKINIISMGSMTTAGIRIDDFLILYLLIHNYRKSTYENIYIHRGVKFLYLLTLSNIVSIITGIMIGLNSNILYPILVIVRKFEYFSLIFVGFNMARKYNDRLHLLEKEYIRLNIYHAIVGLMQLFGVCNYAVSGGESEIFSGFVVSTFNGYYEYGQFLIFSLLFFMLRIQSSKEKVKYVSLFLLSFVLLYYTNSRTSLLCFLIVFCGYILVNRKGNKDNAIFRLSVIAILCIGGVLFFTGVLDIDLGRLSNVSPTMLINNFVNQFKLVSFDEYYYMVKHGIRVTTKLAATSDLSTSIRFFKWSAAIDGFLKYPLFGYGIGITHVMDGHYVRILGETGLFGLILWLLFYTFYIKIFKRLKNVNVFYYFIYLSMLSVMVSATFIDMFDASKNMEFVWLIVGIGCYLLTEEQLFVEGEQQ